MHFDTADHTHTQKKMKKFFFLSVVFSALALAANAQKVYGLEAVAKVGKSFVAKAGPESLPLNPYLYKRVKKAPQEYVLVAYDGENGSVRTLAHKSNVFYNVLAIDSVGYDESADVAEVFLSDKTKYTSSNEEWLKALAGQHVEMWYVDGETAVLQHFRTVPRETALTSVVPVIGATELAQVSAPQAETADKELASTPTPTTPTTPTTPPATHRFVKR